PMKLNVKAMALACGLMWGIGLFSLSWWIIAFDGASEQVTFLGRVYRGYSLTPAGSFFGLLWGFFDGFTGGAIFAWLYNLIAGRAASGQS
ncbi:MAG: bacteriophage holin, partial [Pirellulaceae bacterium]|nr:bacteriophage holin [Pirellulaceae bacterium]